MRWANAGTYCTNLGTDFELPDIYKLLSLASQTEDANEGYIDPIFDDNDRQHFWSSTKLQSDSSHAWAFSFNLSLLIPDNGIANDFGNGVRCFRPE